MLRRTLLFIALLVVAVAATGIAYSAGGGTMTQAQAAGWDCNPVTLIPPVTGYFHCAPPGKPSVADIATPPGSTARSIELRVFNPDGSFAGIESLLRADLYAGQPCPQDNLTKWTLLDLPGADYRACHRFDT